ncbi:hypothetical protein BOTBODRAFT_58037 [Botryobasidium botryosum FD-172 SS1]|uniref:RNA helicase n=1 Tax=Botryobasidium botryosum (strain FD-172 SS1) TaxID=930990 RepID=A0A067M4K7_BOTB1|nr:hypothetical protein BOTBODRAFT_58037 [Botryobasidium botryosum FD-172 SS1]
MDHTDSPFALTIDSSSTNWRSTMPCRDFLNGSCLVEDCPYSHYIKTCDVCDIWCVSDQSYNQHLSGKQHFQKLHGRSAVVQCVVCELPVPRGSYEQHQRGRRHRSLLALQPGEEAPPEDYRDPSNFYCILCRIDVLPSLREKHINGPHHRKKERLASFRSALEEAGRNKHGVTVSHGEGGGLNFGTIEPDSLRTRPTVSAMLTVKLESGGSVVLREARLSSAFGQPRRACFSCVAARTQLVLGVPCLVRVTFSPDGNRGHYDDRIELVFEDTSLAQRFTITRSIRAVVGIKAELDALRPTAPYVRPERRARRPALDVVDGIPPPAMGKVRWVAHFPPYDILGTVTSALASGSIAEKAAHIKKTLLPPVLNSLTYARHWHYLMWIEEDQMLLDLHRYDEEGVGLTQFGKHHWLQVPGLAEKRPSVIVGDKILAQRYACPNDKWYRGHVHVTRQAEVGLSFDRSFHSIKGEKFDVQYELNRTTLRRMHQALDTAFHPDRILFPTAAHVRGSRPPSEMQLGALTLVNRLIQTNPPQRQAVTAIMHQKPGSVPFVVFGPPGTGKTVTIIEAIRQILIRNPAAKILACAPSNSAADLLAARLTDLGSQLFRLNAPSRLKESLPDKLAPFSSPNEYGTFLIPSVAVLARYRVVVSTTTSASIPHGIGLSRGHFSHIFIDEAGHDLEPAAMIPIKTMAGLETNVILSGDPKQLGPIVRSAVGRRELGLGVSYLERLMERELYVGLQWRGISTVKLTKNWRSHPAILKFPNEVFYEGELEARADPVITHSLLRWNGMKSPTFPIIFHSITGKDTQEASSPSYFNPDEVSLVKHYVESLFSDRRLRLTDDDIGIISPYHAQVGKIRRVLNVTHPNIKVGSVEEFQGQERRVIIVSTVRSSVEKVDFDLTHALGFVANHRRFNGKYLYCSCTYGLTWLFQWL